MNKIYGSNQNPAFNGITILGETIALHYIACEYKTFFIRSINTPKKTLQFCTIIFLSVP